MSFWNLIYGFNNDRYLKYNIDLESFCMYQHTFFVLPASGRNMVI